jgi:hypothetical protein
MFDVWSLEHFINGICTAAFVSWVSGILFKKTELSPATRKSVNIMLVLILTLFWECVEHYVEAGILPGLIGARITYWFQGVEHWSNRLIGDIVTVMLGFYVYTRKSNLALPAKIFSVLWFAVHIFVFPDSMYLQRLLFP